jgi:hypothetical protein
VLREYSTFLASGKSDPASHEEPAIPAIPTKKRKRGNEDNDEEAGQSTSVASKASPTKGGGSHDVPPSHQLRSRWPAFESQRVEEIMSHGSDKLTKTRKLLEIAMSVENSVSPILNFP